MIGTYFIKNFSVIWPLTIFSIALISITLKASLPTIIVDSVFLRRPSFTFSVLIRIHWLSFEIPTLRDCLIPFYNRKRLERTNIMSKREASMQRSFSNMPNIFKMNLTFDTLYTSKPCPSVLDGVPFFFESKILSCIGSSYVKMLSSAESSQRLPMTGNGGSAHRAFCPIMMLVAMAGER